MFEIGSFQLFDSKVIIRIKDRICDGPEELLSSKLFYRILTRCVRDLSRRNSRLIGIYDHEEITSDDIELLAATLRFLTHLPSDLVPRVAEGADQFFRDRQLLNDFVEYLYNYWRSLKRLIVCDSIGDRFDKRPYRTFNQTIETLTSLIRSTYRDVQENITGSHPRIYRQVPAGAEIATIALPREIPYPDEVADRLHNISVIRQVLIYPPMIYTSQTNKRTGTFERVNRSPLEDINLNPQEWLCYPAKVGPLVIMVYFSLRFFELSLSLSNLFEMATDEDLKKQPDAVFLFGVPENSLPENRQCDTVFFDDEEHKILLAAIPDRDEFGYFGYLKKMMLTLHNIVMMKRSRLPYHGAMFHIEMRDRPGKTILVMGDTGAGKSETLEAMRVIAKDLVEDITIIADDMGSLEITQDGQIIGYGTEIGAFVRLDDLQPGYAYGQIDRTILMNPAQVNSRVVIPVTTYSNISKGFPVDFVLYANNYEPVDDTHPVLGKFNSVEEALDVFRDGAVMSKGTTSTSGLVKTYFANIFGPLQYPELHEVLAKEYFQLFFDKGIFVGQLRTQLGVSGNEHSGPEIAARALLKILKDGKKK